MGVFGNDAKDTGIPVEVRWLAAFCRKCFLRVPAVNDRLKVSACAVIMAQGSLVSARLHVQAGGAEDKRRLRPLHHAAGVALLPAGGAP